MVMKLLLIALGLASAPFTNGHTIFAQLTADGKTYGRIQCLDTCWEKS